MGLAQQVSTVYNQLVGGGGVTVTRYPVTGVGAVGKVGVTCTLSAVGGVGYGYAAAGAKVVELLAKATLLVPWRLVWLQTTAPSAATIYVVKLGRGAGAAALMTQTFGEFGIDYTVAKGPMAEVILPFCPTVTPTPATDAIVADAASATGAADTIDLAVGVMTGMGT